MHLKELPFTAIGGQPGFDPEELERFVDAPRIAILSYTKRDGTPSQIPIWYRYEGGRFLMISGTTAPKTKALARQGRASLTIQDEMPPYRAVMIEGDVILEEAPTTGGLSSWLATWYFGRVGGNEYRKMVAEEVEKTGLTQVTLDPTRVRGFDNHKVIGAGLRFYMRLRESLPIPRTWM
jgi:PPOX class probable F420-dependent enzyme